MDDGTDARDVLENRLLPLRRGVHLLLPCCVSKMLIQGDHLSGKPGNVGI